MQYLTADEARAWAARRGFHVNESFGHPLASELHAPLWFRIPADAGRRVTLARTPREAAAQGAPEVLVWVTDWSIWPSGEHWPLAEATRRGFGAERPLDETPGHVARVGEDDAGLSMLCLAVLFLWDCWVLPVGEGPAVFVSHHEFGAAAPHGTHHDLRQRLQALGLAYDRG